MQGHRAALGAKTTGNKGITWDKRAALWEGTTRADDPTLREKLTLPDGSEVRLALKRHLERKARAA